MEAEQQAHISYRPFYSLRCGSASFPPHARSAVDGFFWEHCKGWPILACVCVCVEGDRLLPALDNPASWPHSTNLFPHCLCRKNIFSANRCLPLSSRNRMCFCICVCVCVRELFSVPGKYRDVGLFSQETETRLDSLTTLSSCEVLSHRVFNPLIFISTFSPSSWFGILQIYEPKSSHWEEACLWAHMTQPLVERGGGGRWSWHGPFGGLHPPCICSKLAKSVMLLLLCLMGSEEQKNGGLQGQRGKRKHVCTLKKVKIE